MKQTILLFSLLIATTVSLMAQKIVPLEGYEFLQARPEKGQPAGQPKMDCDNLVPDGVSQVTAGELINLSITIDTGGFGPGGAYNCLNCDDLGFGVLDVTESGFTYTADPGVTQGLDTLQLAFCNAAGDDCSFTETVIVLVQRAPLNFNFSTEILSPQERIEITVPQDDLPGGVSCRTFLDCDEDYQGNEQIILFLNGINEDNDFRYQAARFAGSNQVCLQLCNEFGLCDQYNYFFEIVRPNVSLPFFDDFSNDGDRPRLDLWQNEDVLINRNFAIQPPSIGVATFDAVGPRGTPYPINSNGFEPRDRLTSAAINMAGANNQAITFYVQPRGLGNRPEIGDSLRLEFLRPDGIWQHAWSQRGLSAGFGNCLDTAFAGYQVEIPDLYYFNGFQFRFTNLSNQTGALDHWHLDYVKIDDQIAGFNNGDFALISSPPSVVDPYSMLPYRQFVAGGAPLVRNRFEIGLWLHDNEPNPTLNIQPQNPQEGAVQVIDLSNGNELFPQDLNPDELSSVPVRAPYVFDFGPGSTLFDPYRNTLLSFDNLTGEENYAVQVQYQIDGDEGEDDIRQANNSTTTTTIFADSYAYDDGTAELAIEALPGQTVVQRYEAFTDEVLRGVSLRLPRATTSNNANQNIELVVFLGELVDGNEPDLTMSVVPIYVENFFSDSLNGFTSYAFTDSLDVPTGPFYVGWRQTGNCTNCVPVGLDRATIISGTRFFRNGNDWFELDGCSTGALMIRPLVGNSPVPISSTDERSRQNELVKIFPNPASEVLNLQAIGAVDLSRLSWSLTSLVGQRVATGIDANNRIDVSSLPAGTYFLSVLEMSSGKISRHKVVVQ